MHLNLPQFASLRKFLIVDIRTKIFIVKYDTFLIFLPCKFHRENTQNFTKNEGSEWIKGPWLTCYCVISPYTFGRTIDYKQVLKTMKALVLFLD